MGIGLAIGGGLLQGVGQGISDDVAELIKERAADLANQNQKDLLGIQNQYATDRQNSDHAFTAAQTESNHAWDEKYQTNAQTNAVKLAQMGNDAAAARQSAGFAHDDADDTTPDVGTTNVILPNGHLGAPQILNGKVVGTVDLGGPPVPSGATKADPAIAAGAAAGKSPYGGFDANAATAATTWYKGQQGAGAPAAAASPSTPPLQPVTPSLAQPTPGGATPGAGGGAPAPAAPAQPAPSKYPEGAILKQGAATFKVINGQPVYQGAAQ